MKNIKRLLLLLISLSALVISVFVLNSCGDCLHPIKSAYTTVKEATCTEEGRREAVCSDCHEVISEVIKKKAHDYDKYISDNNGSCTFIGTLSAKCKNCDTKKTKLDDGNPYGHTYFDGVCSECDDKMTLVEEFDVSKANDGSVKAKVYLALDGHYELDIVGVGEMRDYNKGESPYNKYSSSIDTLHIYEGVSRIGSYAFSELSLIDEIYIEAGHKSFGVGSFYNKLTPFVTHVYDLDSWVGYDFEDEGIPPLYMTNLIYVGKVKREGDKVAVVDKSTRIGELTLSEGVTEINPYAFYNITHIRTVTIPASVTKIGNYAFYGCGGIEEVYTPSIEAWCSIEFGEKYANPLIYGKNLFVDDGTTSTLIKELIIPKSVSEIKHGAFEGCTGITSLKIEGDIVAIPSFAFANCDGLVSITLSSTVKSIDSWAFYSCDSLRSLTLPDTLNEIKEDSFRDCVKLTTLDIGNGIVSIPDSAFAGCTELLRVRIGENVSSIDDNAFLGCNKIYEINNKSALNVDEHNMAKNHLFIYSDDSESRIVELGAGEVGEGLIFYLDNDSTTKLLVAYIGKANTLNLDNAILGGGYSIYKNAFYSAKIKTLTITSGIDRIYSSAFLGAEIGSLIIESLDEWCKINFDDKDASPVNVAAKVSIGEETDTLTEIKIPATVTTIKQYAFSGFGSVKTFDIPKSVTTIEKGAFTGCISAIKTTSGASYIGKWLISFESGKTSATILQDTVGIAEDAFEDTTVTSFTVSAVQLSILPPDKVVSLTIRDGEIPASAFAPFTSLKSVTINSSVKSVDEGAFASSLVSEASVSAVYLPYLNKELITSLTLTGGNVKRGDVEGFVNLESLVISSGVTAVDVGCFKDMTSIKSLSIRGGINVIPKDTFAGCTSLETVVLHTGVTAIREGAFAGCDGIITTENNVQYIAGWVVGIDKTSESVIISENTIGFADGVLDKTANVKTIYYKKLITDWNKVKHNSSSNTLIGSADVYFYREIAPYTDGKYWHFVDGVPTVWPLASES